MDVAQQETNKQQKTKRTCNFINVRNKADIAKIKGILKTPPDTEHTNTTCLFYVSLENHEQWGVTLKCFPLTEPTHYVWKYSYNYKNGSLVPAIHCSNVTHAVSGEEAREIYEIYNNYKK